MAAAQRELVAALLKLAGDDSPLAGLTAEEIGALDGGLAKLDEPARHESYTSILTRASRDEIAVEADAPPPQEMRNWSMHSYGAMFCEVRVNAVTGETRVSRFHGAIQDWGDAVVIDDVAAPHPEALLLVVGRPAEVCVGRVEEFLVDARDEVGGVGKGGTPPTVAVRFGVPADVVVVNMGVDHDVHILGSDVEFGQAFEEVGVEVAEQRDLRAVAVVADA